MIKFVTDWKTVHKHISFVCMSVFMTALSVYGALPPQLQEAISPGEAKAFAFFLIGLGMIGKYIDQGINDVNGSRNS